MTRVLTVSCAKGGVGKTTTAINLATATAARSHRSVLLVEADLAMANVRDFLDVEYGADDPSLSDVLAGEADVGAATYPVSSGLSVLPAGPGVEGFTAADPSNLRGVIESVRSRYDAVVVDTGAGVSRATLVPMAVADGVVLVATPRVSAVRDARKTAELAERVGGRVVGLVLSRTGSGNAPPPERIADFLDVPLLGSVPDDEAVPRAQDLGQPVIAHAIDAPAARAYWEIAGELSLTASPSAPRARSSEECD